MKQFIGFFVGFCTILISATVGYAQGSVVFTTSKTIEPYRYDEIHGSPYLYENWMPATIVGSDGKSYTVLALNLNGLTKELEIKEEDKTREIRPESYIKVTVPRDGHADIFMRGIHPKLGLDLICILYNGDQVKLIKEFTVRKESSASAISSFDKFVPKSTYYLSIEGQLEQVGLRKKNILKQLDAPAQLEEYLKKTDNSVKSEKELITLLEYYEANNLHK